MTPIISIQGKHLLKRLNRFSSLFYKLLTAFGAGDSYLAFVFRYANLGFAFGTFIVSVCFIGNFLFNGKIFTFNGIPVF